MVTSGYGYDDTEHHGQEFLQIRVNGGATGVSP